MPKSAKGSAFEREFCTKLSIWWTDGEDDSCFWRTSQSGGRATTRRKKGKKTAGHAGDVCATDQRGALLLKYLTFELKRGYSKHTIHDLIDKPDHAAQQEYEKWVEQARRAKQLSEARTWVIVCRRDRRDALIVAPARTLDFFGVRFRALVVLPTRVTLGVAKLQDLWDADPDPVRKFLDTQETLDFLAAAGGGPS